MFSNSSSNIYLNGTNLCATCRDSQGNEHTSSINLNNYIGNIEGTLTWGECNFAASSCNISLRYLYVVLLSLLLAMILMELVISHYSSINLDNYISNIEGTLTAN